MQRLQTAAAIENLAVATYDTALGLDFIGGGSANPVVKAFVTTTKQQHEDHAKAFNAAVTRLGGKPQTQPDPVLLGVVNQAKPGLTDAAAVVDLAIELETEPPRPTWPTSRRSATRTPVRSPPASWGWRRSTSPSSRVKALLAAGAANLIALPPDAAHSWRPPAASASPTASSARPMPAPPRKEP
ncbi:MAG: ferritin-like domain-containing protein [Acidimicrobiia bacterium]